MWEQETAGLLDRAAAIVETCTGRIKEVYGGNSDNLANPTKQDSKVMNLQRVCNIYGALAVRLSKEEGLGDPDSRQQSLRLLLKAGIISEELYERLTETSGFLTAAIKDGQVTDLQTLQSIVENHLEDFKAFTSHLLKRLGGQ